MKKTLRIATRKSVLATWQAEYVKRSLQVFHPDLSVELIYITTSGDKFQSDKLLVYGGKSLFVKELEEAMLRGEADIAVHSMKDVPVSLPDGLDIFAICERGNPFDAFVSNDYPVLENLPVGARVGTSSLRRQSQLCALRPDIIFENLRGNVDTRLKKLDAGQFDAIILAAAGLERLQWQQRISSVLSTQQCLPAVGQGAVGIECRHDDEAVKKIISVLNHPLTYQCVMAERAMNQYLGGGCHMPIAGYACVEQNELHLQGMVSTLQGEKIIRASVTGDSADYIKIGEILAQQLLDKGAKKILDDAGKK